MNMLLGGPSSYEYPDREKYRGRYNCWNAKFRFPNAAILLLKVHVDLVHSLGVDVACAYRAETESNVVQAHNTSRFMIDVGENIGHGDHSGFDFVCNLIIDDNTPDRGHRHNIFNSQWTFVGIACGIHPKTRTSCVMTFADGAFEKEQAQRIEKFQQRYEKVKREHFNVPKDGDGEVKIICALI